MIPKTEYLRSKRLLMACRALSCQHCGIDDGTVVAAHTNWGGGKGRGIKASDNYVAALCYKCHYQIDMGRKLKAERQEIWLQAHKKTVKSLKALGLWPDDIPVPVFAKT